MGQINYQIRKLAIGAGIPKICVPVCGMTIPQVLAETEKVSQSEADLMEWRLDYLDPMPEAGEWCGILRQIRAGLGEKPLLVTYRTRQEGGAAKEQISPEAYRELYRAILKAGEGTADPVKVDLMDIEYNLGKDVSKPLLEEAKEAGVLSVLSYHNFRETPAGEDLLDLYGEMETLGGDVLKIAVMPETEEDLLRLMQVSLRASEACEKPIIAISMGALGVESRICCEVIGSAITFASLSQASAPGQIPVGRLRSVLDIVHESRRK